ncbi:hypothetical protein, partial [Ursidibacter arcticus]|uniref:hypothetical protein n=1 Tax=Ursidibacter arcticus TaxID=1524965 RepID=UPI0019685091
MNASGLILRKFCNQISPSPSLLKRGIKYREILSKARINKQSDLKKSCSQISPNPSLLKRGIKHREILDKERINKQSDLKKSCNQISPNPSFLKRGIRLKRLILSSEKLKIVLKKFDIKFSLEQVPLFSK